MKLIFLFFILSIAICSSLRLGSPEPRAPVFLSNSPRSSNKHARAERAVCVGLTCVPTGQPCNPGAGDICLGPSAFCNETRGSATAVCALRLPVGGRCTASIECQSFLCDFSGPFGVCAEPEDSDSGSTGCEQDSDCEQGQLCQFNQCFGLGVSCEFDADCLFGSYCKNQVCALSIPEGEICDIELNNFNGRQCSPYHSCTPTVVRGPDITESRCLRFYSGSRSSLCTDTIQCNENLTCLLESLNDYGTCIQANRSTGALCDNNAQCSNIQFLECECNLTSKVTTCQSMFLINQVGVFQTYKDLSTCTSSKCPSVYPLSCITDNCLREYCAAYRLYLKEQIESTFPICYLENLNRETNLLCLGVPPPTTTTTISTSTTTGFATTNSGTDGITTTGFTTTGFTTTGVSTTGGGQGGGCKGFSVLEERVGGAYQQNGQLYRIYDITFYNNGSCPITSASVFVTEYKSIDQSWNYNPETGALTLFPVIAPASVYSSAGFILKGKVSTYTTNLNCDSTCTSIPPVNNNDCNVGIELTARSNGRYETESNQFQIYDLSVFNNLGGTKSLKNIYIEIHFDNGEVDQHWNLKQIETGPSSIVYQFNLYGGLAPGGVYSHTSGFIWKTEKGRSNTITAKIVLTQCS